MTREQKITRARELRAQGWTQREIAEQLGVTQGAVCKWLHPQRDLTPERASANAYKAAHRADMRAADARRAAGTQCKHCGVVTGALDAVGEPCCQACKRTPPVAASAATCGRCRARLLTPAALCGFCIEELAWAQTVNDYESHARDRSAA